MKFRSLYPVCLIAFFFALIAGCASTRKSSSTTPGTAAAQAYRELNIYQRFIPKGRYGRWKYRPMNPRYITIHSTQNYSPGADAWRHSLALNNGKLTATMRPGGNRIGYLTWHFTVQDDTCVQHLPTTEQGEHADFDGPGNNYSIGIEMCEHPGNNRAATVARTAKLTAYLMRQYGIPLKNVVPHYHWPRYGRTPANKNCPIFLLDNGRPGRKWQAFLQQVNGYYRQMR
ncbi:MAG: N-acetylmuramoyl-L-alanine amidase [Verrucomicrobiales bacterium]